jgi:prepilin-type N-terminal cleavage/methylation domain-containing protein
MTKGFSLVEVAIVLLIIALLTAVGLPRLRPFLDRIATDQAAREITTALAVGRHGAVMQATRARVTIAVDTLRVDRLKVGRGVGEWEPWWHRPGPADLRVQLEVSNPVVVFGPTGMGWSASNTKVVLRRGSQVETITVSRLGRVKRW